MRAQVAYNRYAIRRHAVSIPFLQEKRNKKCRLVLVTGLRFVYNGRKKREERI